MVHVVASVPHSGTRTLVKHLGLDKNSPRGRWLHFDFDEPLIKKHKPHMHIPVRHPMDVAASWARRGKSLDKLLRAYASMFVHLHLDHTIHKVEDLPTLDGGEDRDRNADGTARVAEYQAAVMSQVVKPHMDFFSSLYDRGIE